MSKKPRENRIPIMMSEAELAAIDTWKDANSIATRSDSIRRLCRIALSLDKELTPLYQYMKEHTEAVNRFSAVAAEEMKKIPENPGVNDLLLSETFMRVQITQTSLALNIRKITAQAYEFKSGLEDLEQMISSADAIRKEFEGFLDRYSDMSSRLDLTAKSVDGMFSNIENGKSDKNNNKKKKDAE